MTKVSEVVSRAFLPHRAVSLLLSKTGTFAKHKFGGRCVLDMPAVQCAGTEILYQGKVFSWLWTELVCVHVLCVDTGPVKTAQVCV